MLYYVSLAIGTIPINPVFTSCHHTIFSKRFLEHCPHPACSSLQQSHLTFPCSSLYTCCCCFFQPHVSVISAPWTAAVAKRPHSYYSSLINLSRLSPACNTPQQCRSSMIYLEKMPAAHDWTPDSLQNCYVCLVCATSTGQT